MKLEKVTDIKKINAQMMAIKSEISKNEDTLKDYMLYKQFLDTLTPQVCSCCCVITSCSCNLNSPKKSLHYFLQKEFKEKARLRRLEKVNFVKR